MLEAIHKARELGVRLLVISNDAENPFVKEHLKGATWLGLVHGHIASFEKDAAWKEFANQRGWGIVDDASPPTYFRWQKDQPQGHPHEVGAAIHANGMWYDYFGTDRLFICYERRLATGPGGR